MKDLAYYNNLSIDECEKAFLEMPEDKLFVIYTEVDMDKKFDYSTAHISFIRACQQRNFISCQCKERFITRGSMLCQPCIDKYIRESKLMELKKEYGCIEKLYKSIFADDEDFWEGIEVRQTTLEV